MLGNSTSGKYNGEVMQISPEEIIIGHNGRKEWENSSHGHHDQDINRMVESYLRNGQIQAVEVRRNDDAKFEIVLGYCRLLAAIKFNQLYPEKKMMLMCCVRKMSDEEAFMRNIEENRVRKSTSAIDDAMNQKKLRDEYGWSEKRISEYYAQHLPQIYNNKKLLELTTSIQYKVHVGEITVQAALSLFDLTKDEQTEIIKEVENRKDDSDEIGKKKPKKSAAIMEEARKIKARHGNKKTVPRTVKAFLDFCEEMTNPTETKSIQIYHQKLIDFMKGKIADTDLFDFAQDCFAQDLDKDEIVQVTEVEYDKTFDGEEENDYMSETECA